MNLRRLHRDLVELHGQPDRAYSEDGVRQLLTTILSQNVTDTQTARAAESLFATYPDYRAMENAEQSELADVISDVGLMNQKSRRIQRSLTRIREETGGEYTLAFLEAMATDDAQAWLTDIKGIGPKTASVVLNFHFEKPTFAVDTHIERLATRFGLIDEATSAEAAHEVLNETVPDDIKYSLHVLLIAHGKQYCSAQNADCTNAVCETYCDCEFC
ncbi:endonuclease III domain-containing protein [Halorientalis sp.]|uniref:endonuclease III domain-containing protein n=1 Tax=Halorientalis sp. TaxID=1931229 RepID=UPI00263A217B|nr:endonuclease III [Halorientalis sp.]